MFTKLSVKQSGVTKRRDSEGVDEKSVGMLRKMLDEKDARILQLETTIAEVKIQVIYESIKSFFLKRRKFRHTKWITESIDTPSYHHLLNVLQSQVLFLCS